MRLTCAKIVLVSVGIGGGVSLFKLDKKSTSSPKQVYCDHKVKPQEFTLIGAQVFFRHGARTPLKHAPGLEEAMYDKELWTRRHTDTDIAVNVVTLDGSVRPPSPLEQRYQKVTFPGGMGAGVLTYVGRDQAYALGRKLREKYILQHRLVSDEFTDGSVVTRSTNVNRCVQSLQCVIAGMYERKKIKDTVTIRVMPVQEDTLFPNPHLCPTLKELEKMVPGFLKTQNGYRFVAHYIKYFTGDNTDKYIDLMNYRDHFVARKAHGLEIPPWLEAVNESLQKEAAKVVAAFTAGTKDDHFVVMQLSAGPMFHMLEQNFEKIMKNDKTCPKLHLYSGHDTTLVPLLVGVGAWEDVWPPYSSYVAFELYRNRAGKHFMKTVYNGQDVILPGFEESIVTYEDFKKAVAPYMTSPSQYTERCHNMELARETAEFWEAMKASREEEEEEYPPNM